MAKYNTPPLARLTEQFERLPGIGSKTAQRLAYHVLKMPKQQAIDFADAIVKAHEQIHYCKICCNFTDKDVCNVCGDLKREKNVICVVEDPKDVIALEKTGEFHAMYHVLHGSISPLNGIGPDQLHIKELMSRVSKDDEIKEIIMATNPTVEGEATAIYMSKLLKPLGVKVTRLAYGIPVGADLEFADEVTLARALEGRNEL